MAIKDQGTSERVDKPPGGSRNGAKSFWATLPGILTGIAGILTAVGAILAIVLGAGGTPHASPGSNTGSGQGSGVVQGSGGSTPGSGGASETPSNSGSQAAASAHDAWVTQANRICQDVNAENLPTYNTGDPAGTRLAELQTISGAAVKLNRRLRALPAAAADQAQVTRMLQLWDTAAGYWYTASVYLQQGNFQAELAAVQAADEPNQQGNDIARGLGIGNCADVQL